MGRDAGRDRQHLPPPGPGCPSCRSAARSRASRLAPARRSWRRCTRRGAAASSIRSKPPPSPTRERCGALSARRPRSSTASRSRSSGSAHADDGAGHILVHVFDQDGRIISAERSIALSVEQLRGARGRGCGRSPQAARGRRRVPDRPARRARHRRHLRESRARMSRRLDGGDPGAEVPALPAPDARDDDRGRHRSARRHRPRDSHRLRAGGVRRARRRPRRRVPERSTASTRSSAHTGSAAAGSGTARSTPAPRRAGTGARREPRERLPLREAAIPLLRANGGGAIVTVSSALGLVGGDRDFATHAYAASKAGLIGLTRAMAVTTRPRGSAATPSRRG